jgi:hypothetical protein
MTTKHDVIRVHEAHPDWHSERMAQHLGCVGAYVRAVARREGLVLVKKNGGGGRRHRNRDRDREIVRMAKAGVERMVIAKWARISLPRLQAIVRHGRVEIPPWVPDELQDVYRVVASAKGEETAAHHCRLLKQKAAA